MCSLLWTAVIASGVMHLNEDFEDGDFYFTNENLSSQVRFTLSSVLFPFTYGRQLLIRLT